LITFGPRKSLQIRSRIDGPVRQKKLNQLA
jgi:hypothetical protein